MAVLIRKDTSFPSVEIYTRGTKNDTRLRAGIMFLLDSPLKHALGHIRNLAQVLAAVVTTSISSIFQ